MPARQDVYIRKYGGNDSLSWAVFKRGNPTPIVSGLGRAEAEGHKRQIKAMFAEKAARRETM